MIADNAAKLVVTLRTMETISTALATFWTRKHLMFMGQAQKLISNTSHLPQHVLETMLDKDLKVWDEAKSEFQKYSEEMSAVAEAFEFNTNARPLPTKEFRVDQLTITIPTSVDVDGI